MFGRTYPRRTPPHSSPHPPRRPRRPPRWNAATATAAARILDVVVTPPFPLGWTANGWLGLGSGPYGTTGQLAGRAWQLMRAMYGSASHDGLDGLDNGLDGLNKWVHGGDDGDTVTAQQLDPLDRQLCVKGG